jgi:hypothetical protein
MARAGRNAEQRPGRLGAERCLALLQTLALHMQTHRKGRQVQLPAHLAAEALAGEFGERAGDGTPSSRHLIERAQRFLDEEELGRLLAPHFPGIPRRPRHRRPARSGAAGLLFDLPARFYQAEWREVVLLLAAVLHQQGRPKVDGLIALALDRLAPKPKLAEQARAAGLLGLMLRDLAPLDYEVADARYLKLLDAVLGVFDAKRSRTISIETRVEAADALGQSGDPRLEPGHPERYVLIPAGSFQMGAHKDSPIPTEL